MYVYQSVRESDAKMDSLERDAKMEPKSSLLLLLFFFQNGALLAFENGADTSCSTNSTLI
jgi:hypothetical protein